MPFFNFDKILMMNIMRKTGNNKYRSDTVRTVEVYLAKKNHPSQLYGSVKRSVFTIFLFLRCPITHLWKPETAKPIPLWPIMKALIYQVHSKNMWSDGHEWHPQLAAA